MAVAHQFHVLSDQLSVLWPLRLAPCMCMLLAMQCLTQSGAALERKVKQTRILRPTELSGFQCLLQVCTTGQTFENTSLYYQTNASTDANFTLFVSNGYGVSLCCLALSVCVKPYTGLARHGDHQYTFVLAPVAAGSRVVQRLMNTIATCVILAGLNKLQGRAFAQTHTLVSATPAAHLMPDSGVVNCNPV